MTMSKSEAAHLIASGKVRESFHHDTLGHFDISALREMIQRDQPELRECPFHAMVPGQGLVDRNKLKG